MKTNTTILMVKVNGKVKRYTAQQRALAAADARDYGSTVEEYRVLDDNTFVRVA